MKKTNKLAKFLFLPLAVIAIGVVVINSRTQQAEAVCTQAQPGAGTVTTTVNVPTAGTYRVWSRMMAGSNQNNSYFLEINNDPCIVVGDSSSLSNTVWSWVNYRDGNTSSPISVTLSAGNHTFKMIGRESNVRLDRIILTTDTSCVPTGIGENCANPADTTPPTVSMTAPANNATISGTVTVSANADDNVGVTRVEFYRSGSTTPLATRTSAPYSFSFNTTNVTNGTYTLTARAYDAANNSTTSSGRSVTINNVTEPELVEGDVNGNGCVDIFDLSTLLSNYGRTSASRGQGDLDGNGTVNVFDLSRILSNWGRGC